MKTRTNLVLVASAAISLLAADFMPLRAQQLPVSISGIVRSPGVTTDNGKTTTTTINQSTMTTATLLRQLASDENAIGNWPSNTFPAGARLAFGNDTGFQVTDARGNLLLSASNIVSLQTIAELNLAGRTVDTTGAGAQSQLEIVTFSYDASPLGTNASPASTNNVATNSVAAGYRFTVTGAATATSAISAATNQSTEADSFLLHNGIGAGTNANGTNFIITGFTLSAADRITSTSPTGPIATLAPVPPATPAASNTTVFPTIPISSTNGIPPAVTTTNNGATTTVEPPTPGTATNGVSTTNTPAIIGAATGPTPSMTGVSTNTPSSISGSGTSSFPLPPPVP